MPKILQRALDTIKIWPHPFKTADPFIGVGQKDLPIHYTCLGVFNKSTGDGYLVEFNKFNRIPPRIGHFYKDFWWNLMLFIEFHQSSQMGMLI